VDQSTFTSLTGITPTPAQAAIFDSVVEMAGELLAEALGWPLDPEDWGNQYTESGILPDPDSWDFDWDWVINTADLNPPDEVVGQLRQFRWAEDERKLFIDPATAIHAVKLVKDNVTVHVFDPQHYRFDKRNGPTTYGKYIELRPNSIITKWLLFLWAPLPEVMFGMEHRFCQLVVDADWGFEGGKLPTPLMRVWAEQIAYEMDLKRDITSENMLGHSYGKKQRDTPVTKYLSTLQMYAGPNSSVIKPGFLA